MIQLVRRYQFVFIVYVYAKTIVVAVATEDIFNWDFAIFTVLNLKKSG